jgi:hypothetical protein
VSMVAPRVEAPTETVCEQRTARKVHCPGCESVVVEAPLRGGELTVLVDSVEVLPLMECPTCRNKYGRRPRETPASGDTYFTHDTPCWRCGAKPGEGGIIGELDNPPGVALGEDGFARLLPPGFERHPGESVHRTHRCGVLRSA